jgi:hypothetical protein
MRDTFYPGYFTEEEIYEANQELIEINNKYPWYQPLEEEQNEQESQNQSPQNLATTERS